MIKEEICSLFLQEKTIFSLCCFDFVCFSFSTPAYRVHLLDICYLYKIWNPLDSQSGYIYFRIWSHKILIFNKPFAIVFYVHSILSVFVILFEAIIFLFVFIFFDICHIIALSFGFILSSSQ